MKIVQKFISSLKNRQNQPLFMGKLHEYGILVFAFSIPILEAPKHMGFLMMLTGFMGMAFHSKSTQPNKSIRPKTVRPKTVKMGKIDSIEWVVMAIMLSSIISTLINWPLPDDIKGVKYTFYCLTTFWMLYKTKYSIMFLKKIPIALVAGTLAGICWAEYHLFFTPMPLPEIVEFELKFNSINSVSRSGAFTATILFVCLGVIMDKVCQFSRKTIFFFFISWVVTSASSMIMGGRGNVLGIFGAYLVLLILLFKHKKYLMPMGIQTLVALIAVMVLQLDSGSVQAGRLKHLLSTKFTTNVSDMALHDQIRYDYWRLGIAQISQHPSLFGLGPLNFKSLKIEDIHLDPPLLKQTRELMDETPDHSHNWILTKWVEDGFMGIIFFTGFILILILTLLKYRPGNKNTDVNWIWIAAFSAIITACISGLFNSAFTHENGWLTFFLMGLGTGYTTQKQDKEQASC